MRVAAIMPCRGRREQTEEATRRLVALAGYEDWMLTGVVGDEPTLAKSIHRSFDRLITAERALSYWQALQAATNQADAPLLANLANDLLAAPNWLRNAVSAYRATFGDGPGMIGFNGDGYGVEHSCHFLIHRTLLDRYGGWPVWYQHNFGDTELCQRAIADGLYAKAPWAVLYHNHWRFGADYDPTYQAGDATFDADRATYDARKARGWR